MERLRNTVTPMKITLPNKIEDLENPTTNLERPQPIKAEGSKILNKYKKNENFKFPLPLILSHQRTKHHAQPPGGAQTLSEDRFSTIFRTLVKPGNILLQQINKNKI